MEVSVLGVLYTLEYKTKAECETLEHCDGFCDSSTKRIVVRTYTEEEKKDPTAKRDLEAYQRRCMRHELTHAFLYESGLAHNSLVGDEGWAENEEMIDWVAIQGPKLYAAWQLAKCL